MIYQTLNKSQFINAFKSWDTYANNFSYEGLEVLFDALTDMGSDDFELDVVALCCDFSELTVDEIINSYGLDDNECDSEAERHTLVSDYLSENTWLCGEVGNNSYLFKNF